MMVVDMEMEYRFYLGREVDERKDEVEGRDISPVDKRMHT